MDTHKIVIVGAGFAGLRTALELAKRRARLKAFEITLIDRNAAHAYTPLLYEVSSGELDASNAACAGELRSGVSVPLGPHVRALKKSPIRFCRADVAGIDWEQRQVRLSRGEPVPFDDLIIAAGVESSDGGVPGAHAFALPMKTLHDAFRVRARIHGLLEAYARGERARVAVTVVGGGPTGVEFAAETANAFARLERDGAVRKGDASVSLAQAGPDILPASSPKVRAIALERLARLGVTVRTNTRLDAPPTEGDAVVWTAGVRPIRALAEWGLPVDERGYVTVDKTFAVEGKKNVHALGDCAAFFHPKTKARVPALAQAAVREAGVVAENVVRHLERKLPMSWNPPERWISVIPLGGAYAVADFGWMRLSGISGYAVRKLADLSYFLSILPPREAWKRWREGSMVYNKND